MSSRDEVLASLRANLPRLDRPLPSVPLFAGRPAASLLAFKESLESMGGVFLDPPASGDVLAPVREKIANAKVVCSTVPEIAGNRDISSIGAPQDLADVDFAIVRAAFAVAEMGSVLLSDRELGVQRRRLSGAAPDRPARSRRHHRQPPSRVSPARVPRAALCRLPHWTVRHS